MPLSSPVYHHDQLEKTIITVAMLNSDFRL